MNVVNVNVNFEATGSFKKQLCAHARTRTHTRTHTHTALKQPTDVRVVADGLQGENKSNP